MNYEIVKSNDIYCVNCHLKINAGIMAVSFYDEYIDTNEFLCLECYEIEVENTGPITGLELGQE